MVDSYASSGPQINGLIIENTFTSLPGAVRDFPIIGWFSFLCNQKWDSLAKIRLIPPTVPILMLSGLQDKLVRPHHMTTLWKTAGKRGQSKKGKETEPNVKAKKDLFVSFDFGAHVNTDVQSDYWSTVEEFFRSIRKHDKDNQEAQTSGATTMTISEVVADYD